MEFRVFRMHKNVWYEKNKKKGKKNEGFREE